MAKRVQQISYSLSTVWIVTIIVLLLGGLMPATTNAWAPSRIEGTNESVGDKDKDKHKHKQKDKDKDGDGKGNGDGDGNGDGEIPLDRSYDLDVLVISYFPLTEEGTVDVDITGEGVLEGVSYEEIKQKTEDITNNLVLFREEASRYLGYADSSAEPALDYHIFGDAIEHLEAVPIDADARVPLYPDYPGIMSDHDICDYVDNRGIDEVWIWAYQGYPETKLHGSESRMSGPFGDISNSWRFNDMPICTSTYVVYTYNYARGTAEAFENWGHQIEVELAHVDNPVDDILGKFMGPNYPRMLDVIGRCGSVHNAPNAAFEYDRFSPDPHPSDCLDWDPDGLGELSDISCETWGCGEETDTGNSPLLYMIWHWQNLPGINNSKEYQGEQLRNWWDLQGDFDNVMANSRRLTVN
jgi:hypothetical protein